jgi:hypothetical protein
MFCVGEAGKISWKGNWVAFVDNIMQMKILQMNLQSLLIPTYIQKLTIDVKQLAAYVQEQDSEKEGVGEFVLYGLNENVHLWHMNNGKL